MSQNDEENNEVKSDIIEETLDLITNNLDGIADVVGEVIGGLGDIFS